jgi:carboxyl-terminal processing protease
VRYVEPQSDAAAKGVQRGDRCLDQRPPAAEIIAADDFSALWPQQCRRPLTLVLRNAGVERSVSLVRARPSR